MKKKAVFGLLLVWSFNIFCQNDTLLNRYKGKIAVKFALSYSWDNEYGHPYYEMKFAPTVYYYPWKRTGFGVGTLNIVANDITDKSHFRHFYFTHFLVQQRFLHPHLYVEGGLGWGNYSSNDTATIRIKPKIAFPFGFGANFKVTRNLYVDLSFITYYQLHELPSDIYRIGIEFLIDPKKKTRLKKFGTI
jgi:hypothetical protein